MTGLAERLRATPALHLADQVLSSGTNFLAVVVVARNGTPQQFGVFSIFLVVYYVSAGFNRSVPHAIAMTMEWDDERARSGYFFLPPLAVGLLATIVLVATYAVVDPSWLFLPLFLVPFLLQDAARMHAFSTQRPQVALGSDAVWLAVAGAGFLVASTPTGAAAAWAVGGLGALLVTRPWGVRVRVQRRPVRANVVSAALEYATLSGLGFLTPLLATPIITLVGVGALQGSNVIRGPIILLVQGLLVHRMSGPPITPRNGVREALHLSGTTLAVTLACIPPLYLLREVYGPRLLGATWPEVAPLVVPALICMVVGSTAFGPATVARKMGRFSVSAKLQGALVPVFVGLPLLGAAVAGPEGFLYATAAAYAAFSTTWWIVLPRLTGKPVARADLAVT
jgi:hypothetical protein